MDTNLLSGKKEVEMGVQIDPKLLLLLIANIIASQTCFMSFLQCD